MQTLVKPISVYLHVPFCRAKCLYCNFTSRPAGPSTQTQYIENLCAEMREYFKENPNYHVNTVYIGGGTPSCLETGDIELLLRTIKQIAPKACEITFEANPHPDDLEKISTIIRGGVNRISIGVQSFNENELGLTGRLHTVDDSRRFIKKCKRFKRLSVSFDLIHGLPEQTLDSFRRTVEEAVSYNPDHISLYGLSIENESRLGNLPECQFKNLNIPDGDLQADMYDFARDRLKSDGYIHYELSNFARPDKMCRHNLVYWTGGDYIGFGPSAASYIDGIRFTRISDVNKYISSQNHGENTVGFSESLPTEKAAAEAIVLALRMSEGCSRKKIETKYGVDLTNLIGEALRKYTDQGFIEMEDDNIRLTDRAYFVSNAIFREIVQ